MSWHISNVMEKEFESSRYLRAQRAESQTFSLGGSIAVSESECAQDT